MAPDEIDLRHYMEVLWKWRLAIILLTGVAVVVSAVFSYFVLSPVYETKVTLSVSNAVATQQSARQDDTSITETLSRIQPVTLNTYVSEITSPFLMKRVVEKMGLALSPTDLQSMVAAQVLKDTNLIEVRVQNTDRVLASDIANTIATEFVDYVSEKNQERMAKSLQFLEEQKQGLQKEMQGLYAELSAVQSKPDNVTYLTREIGAKTALIDSLRTSLSETRLEKSILETELAVLDRTIANTPQTLEGEEGSPPRPNPTYTSLLDERVAKVTSISMSESRIYALEKEIATLESSLLGLESRLVKAQNEEAVLRASLSRIETTLSLLNGKIVEAQMAHSLNLGETTISITSPALEPTHPVKPRKLLNMAVAGVLGGFSSVLLVFVLEYLDNTIKTQDDVQKHLGLATLGVIPLFDQRNHRK